MYTNPWSNTIPLGTDIANTIDDSIRQLRLDISDRMNSIVVDWAADPVVLQPQSGGPFNGKNIFVHHSLFQPISPLLTWTVGVTPTSTNIPQRVAESFSLGSGAATYNGANVKFWAPIILPVGATITGVVFNMTQGSGAALNMKLRKVVFNTAPTPPTSSDILATVTNTSVFAEYIINGTYVILNNDVLFLEVEMNTVSVFYNAAITYNITDVTQTI